jgi:transposase
MNEISLNHELGQESSLEEALLANRNTDSRQEDSVSKWQYIQIKSEAHYWKAQFKKSKEINCRLQSEIHGLKEKHSLEIKELNSTIEKLEAKLKLREKQLFGKKSEKGSSSNQFASTNTNKNSRGQQRNSKGHGRTNRDNLPIKNEILDLNDADKCCSTCHKPFEEFGQPDKTEIIEVDVKAHKRIIVRPQYKPTCQCPNHAVITAPPPSRLIPKGLLGVSAWVEIVLSKFEYYIPHYRQLRLLKDLGLNLAQGTITGGLKTISENYLEPIYAALQQRNRIGHHWHADETRWEVYIHLEEKEGHRWYIWVFHSEDTVVYFIDPSRSSKIPRKHLHDCMGILSVDRYSAYKVFLKGSLILLAFCWAHVRRDFLELAKKHSDKDNWAMHWVEKIGELYSINKQRLLVLNEQEKFQQQQNCLTTALTKMHDDSQSEQARFANKKNQSVSDEACVKVLESLDNHWSGLTLFAEHPEIAMDNNTAENDLRGPVVLRKNSRGSGSQWSGECMIKTFSILKTLAHHKLNPRTWFTQFFQACADAGAKMPKNWRRDFLPWNMSKQRKNLMCMPLELEDTS